ncbi:TetR family transcriptional regulator [Microbacteriaceae bacterium VKM Ac-2854]|nr:TetR family transcriptional regulator [Microbacteriaceae bacterium VKM Ac-2854]
MPRIGRPPTVDAEAIAVRALRLFAVHGYDSSTMADVAVAAGVSRSTLFRFYPSKGDLVWGGLPAANGRFLEAWESVLDRDLSTVRAAFVAAASFPESQREAARLRLRLIASTPSLQTAGWFRQQQTAGMLVDALVAVSTPPVDLFRIQVAATVIASAVDAALMLWARGDTDDLSTRVDDALRMLEFGLADALSIPVVAQHAVSRPSVVQPPAERP